MASVTQVVRMIKITDVLMAEHATFVRVFDHVERALSTCRTVGEVHLLGSVVEGLLQHHGETEEHLVYSVLDHALEERGELTRMHHDHHEIDGHLQRIAAERSLDAARERLKAALLASREHFRNEEAAVFPLIGRVLRPETLTELGRSYLERSKRW
jgi:hypothetical protein